jgi:thiol-disulfide isomerase/thioredoxin
MQQINVRSETPSSIIKMKKYLNDTNNTIVVAILADWCGACQQFKPIWESTTKNYISTLTEHQKKKKLIIATIQDTTIPELGINDIQGFPTIRLIKDRKVINESLGGMSEEMLMEFIKNAHKQCIVISPKKQKSKIKKQNTRKQKTNKKTNKKNTKKRTKSKKQIQKGGMFGILGFYSSNNKNVKKTNKSKKNKSLARKFKVRSSYSQKKRKTKRFRPKLKIIDESKTMSGGGKYIKSKNIKKREKRKNKKGGYDSSISRAQEQRIREEQQRAERRAEEFERLREQSRELRRKRVIADANRLFPQRSYIYPQDYDRAQHDIEDHRLHERIMRTSVLPKATEVPVAVTPSRNMFSRYIGTPLSRMLNRTRRRRGRIQPDVVTAIPIASTVYEGNYLDDI